MDDIFTLLDDYAYSDYYPFHMPGHKRNFGLNEFFEDFYKHDISEIEGFDNLHNAEGIIYDSMKRAASMYGSDESFFLINGSTAGVLTAISAAVPRDGRLLMSRFSHKSAYHAALVRNIKLSYMYPKVDSELGMELPLTLDDVKMGVEKEKINAVFITSPTYCGYSSDIRAIADYLHEKRIPLIVDAAHGAHFGMADFLPEHANALGADIVINSLHKTLPAPTQTAILHINGSLVDREKVCQFLRIYQSSSPSYVLMAGIDNCFSYLDTGNAVDRWQEFYENRKALSESLKDLKYLGIRDHFTDESIEMGRMMIYSKSTFINGKKLYERLIEKHHLQPEMAMPSYVLLIFTLFDTKEGFDRLSEALHIIDEKLKRKEEGFEDTIALGNLAALFSIADTGTQGNNTIQVTPPKTPEFPIGKKVVEVADAIEMESKMVNLIDAEREISKVFVGVYPPGQPVLVPGEEITKETLQLIKYYRRHGFDVEGLSGDYIEVVRRRQI